MNILGIVTLFRKENFRFKSVLGQTVLAPVVTNVLFLMIFGVAFGSRASEFEGHSYMATLIPGLAAMGIMMNAFQNPSSSLMIAKYTNAINELLMLPLRGFEILTAYIASALVRGILVGAATLGAGLLFAPVPLAHPWVVVLFSFLIGGIFASLGAILGIVAKDFDQSALLQNFVLTPLMYLGGVFFSVGSLPGVASIVARANPLFYLVDGFRYGFLGVGDAPFALSLAVTLVLCVGSFAVASWMFQTGYKLKT